MALAETCRGVAVNVTTVLGIDPSTTATGLAVWHLNPTGTVRTTVTTLETDAGDPMELRWHQMATRIWAHIDTGHTVAVMEGAVDRTGRGNTTQVLAELRGVIRYGLWLRGVPYAQPRPTTVKKYAGNGSWGKETMMLAARQQMATAVGWPRTFDEADAMWCMAMGMERIGRSVVARTIRRAEALMVVDWPETWPSQMEGDTPE